MNGWSGSGAVRSAHSTAFKLACSNVGIPSFIIFLFFKFYGVISRLNSWRNDYLETLFCFCIVNKFKNWWVESNTINSLYTRSDYQIFGQLFYRNGKIVDYTREKVLFTQNINWIHIFFKLKTILFIHVKARHNESIG